MIDIWAYTFDICEYLVNFINDNSLKDSIKPIADSESVTLHISCHSRAQNIGQKATELLRMIPNIKLDVIERCSGHGGSWGVKKDNFDMAIKVGKPVQPPQNSSRDDLNSVTMRLQDNINNLIGWEFS